MRGQSRALLLVPALALVLAGCGNSSDNSTVTPPQASSSTPAGTTAASTAPAGTAGIALTIQGFAYDPTPLTVAPGAKVAVTNRDSAEHTATSDKKGLFEADDVAQGKTVSFTAPTTAGTYTFYCKYHSSMHGTLIVK
ncbi:MAG: plastocyanin [Frankiales bacterium]|nr:plastocyanin [Frankiales bacterium]